MKCANEFPWIVVDTFPWIVVINHGVLSKNRCHSSHTG